MAKTAERGPDSLLAIGDSIRHLRTPAEPDGELIVTIPSLSRLSIELGREPCRGHRLGIQAAATTEVTVDRFAASH